jgi:GNAT superfamily N-acetyltransferase
MKNDRGSRWKISMIVFGAFCGSDLVGVTGLRREPLVQVAHWATLWGVFVEPEWRGLALLAGYLKRRLPTLAKRRCCKSISTYTLKNPCAQRLYQLVGFESYGLEPRAIRVDNRFYDEERMVLRLDD